MDGCQRLHCLKLNDNPPVHQEIHPVPALKFDIFVDQRKRPLTIERNGPHSEFPSQAFFVSRFEQPGPERSMNFDRGADYLMRKFGVSHLLTAETQRTQRKKCACRIRQQLGSVVCTY